MSRLNTIAWVAVLLVLATDGLAAPPRVVSSTVEDGQDDVDPALTEIRVAFDQPMDPRSWSIVGGGPMFPEVVGRPRWVDAKTLAITVKLQPDREYRMALNSETFQGFRSRAGEPAAPQPLAFKTRAAAPAAEPGEALPPERNREAVASLRKAIDTDYAYRDRLKVDWDKVFAQHAPAMEAARTSNQFARVVAKVLREAQDAHVYVQAGGRTIGTHVNAKAPNYDVQTLRRVVPEWKEHGGGVVTGKLAGDVGYLLIPEWSPAAAQGLDEAFAVVRDAKGLILDVRMNGGGDENLARRFAGRLVEGPKVYSKNRIRRDGQWQGPFDRVVEPAAEGERYRGPVAVLIGPKVASSCESFVLMARQGLRCKLVGDVTKGSSGNPRPYELGNGVTVFLSSWEDQLPDGTVLEGRGVTPDVAVKTNPAALRQRDGVLEAALASLRKEGGTGASNKVGVR
jgi:hypothetical protein